jgi:hypothetical protein
MLRKATAIIFDNHAINKMISFGKKQSKKGQKSHKQNNRK